MLSTLTQLYQVERDVQEGESFLQVDPELLQPGKEKYLTAILAYLHEQGIWKSAVRPAS